MASIDSTNTLQSVNLPDPTKAVVPDYATNTNSTASNYNATNADATGYDAALAQSQGYHGADANSVNARAANAGSQGYDASTAGSQGYDASLLEGPTQWAVDNNQLASGQLNNILSSDSALMQQTGAQARQASNDRGLINSTMGVQAGQSAMIGAATPIAQSNASTYANAAQFNANAANQFALANQGASNTASQFGASAANTANLANAQFQNNASQFGANAANTASLANANANTSVNVANAQSLNTANLANAQAQNTANQFSANAANTASLANAQAQNAAGQYNANATNTANLANAQAANAANQFNAAQNTQNSQFNATNANATSQFNAAANNKAIADAQQYGASLLQAQMDNQTKQLVSTNQAAQQSYQSSMASITAIMTNSNLTPDEKKAMVDSQVGMMQGGLSLIDAVTKGTLDTNLRSLLNIDTSKLPEGAIPVSTMNAIFSANTTNTTNGGGGGKVICTRLHQLGRLSDELYGADSRVGGKLLLSDPACVLGYQMLAKPIVERMHCSTPVSRVYTRIVEFIAMPMVRELAKMGGHGDGGGWHGRLMLKTLMDLARAYYKRKKPDAWNAMRWVRHGY